MSKMSELALLINELKKCGETLTDISEGLFELFSGDEEKPAKRSAKAEKTEKTVTLEEVRAVLAEKSRAGKTEQVKAIITAHGADKLSEIDPSEFAAVLSEAEVL